MADISQLSNADLMAALGGAPASAVQGSPLQSMSDADLMSALGQQPTGSAMSADNLVRSAAQGIPIVGGLADKFAAGMDALTQPILGRGSDASTLSDRYSQNAAAEQAHTNAFDTAHPIASTLAGVAGGTAALAPIAGTAAGARALGFGEGPLLGNVARGVASGAAIGGTDAAVRGQDPISGAEWGGAFGGIAPVAGRAIGSVANRVMNPLTPTGEVALNKVAAPLERAGLGTPDALSANLANIGPEAALVDAHPELTQYGGTIAASPGPGQQIMRDFVQQRAAGAGDRITNDLDQIMGKPVDLNKLSDQIYSDAKAKAGPLYGQAYSTPIESSPELDAALNTPFGKAALAKAKSLGLSEPNAPPSAMFSAPKPQASPALPDWAQGVMAKGGPGADNLRAALGNSGLLAPEAGPAPVDVRGLHLVRQAFDDMIQPAIRTGATKKAAVLQGLRSTVDDTLKSVQPMAQADSIYASRAKVRDALADGLGAFKNGQTPEDISANIANMSDAERQAYVQGGRVAIRNSMGTARSDAGAARRLFAQEYNQEKLKLLVGNEGANSILKRIGAEETYANTNNRVSANSETASRALGKAELADAHGLPSYRDVAVFSGAHGLVRRAIQGAISHVLDTVSSGRQKEIETAIANLLTTKGISRGPALEELMGAALKRDPTGRLNRVVSQVVARLPRPGDGDPRSRQTQIFQQSK